MPPTPSENGKPPTPPPPPKPRSDREYKAATAAYFPHLTDLKVGPADISGVNALGQTVVVPKDALHNRIAEGPPPEPEPAPIDDDEAG